MARRSTFSFFVLSVILAFFCPASARAQLQDNGLPPNFVMSSMAWSPDGTRLVSGFFGGFVRVIDAATGETIFEVPSGSQQVTAVAWSPDGSMLASANYNGTIQVRDANTGRLVQEMISRLGSVGVLTLLWSPDSQHLISSVGETGVLQIWEVISGAVIDPNVGGIYGQMVWSADATQLLVSGAVAVRILDAESYREVAGFLMPEIGTVTTNGGQVTAAAWSPDGTLVASGSYNGQVRLWDVETGEMLDEFRGNYAPVMGSFETVIRGVRFSRDGSHLIAVSADGSSRTWDIETRHEVAHSKTDVRISATAWSPDSCWLAYGRIVMRVSEAGENLYGVIPLC